VAKLRYDAGVAVAPAVITLRPLRQGEIPRLAWAIPEVGEAQIANRWREQALGYRELLVAESGDEIVGTVSLAQAGKSLHLFALEVAPALRGRGLGGEIVSWVVEEARRRGLRRVYLEVRCDNPARRLYHRLGFRRVGGEFVNAWWRFNDDGTRERVEEASYRMVKRVR
jgi:ribosomal protein S18 acetylase RimI-like enzyme